MKTFRDLVVVKKPLEDVWACMRDRLPELAEQLDDIDKIVCLEREEVNDTHHKLLNRWYSTHTIPHMLQGVLGSDEVSWLDRNEWDGEQHICRWTIEPSVLPEHIHCHGQTIYTPAMGGRGTRITFSGEFELVAGALNKLAGPLEKPFTGFIEALVTTLIPKNLRRVIDAANHVIAEDLA